MGIKYPLTFAFSSPLLYSVLNLKVIIFHFLSRRSPALSGKKTDSLSMYLTKRQRDIIGIYGFKFNIFHFSFFIVYVFNETTA